VQTGRVPVSGSMYVVGPLIAFGVIAAFGAVLRWTFDGELTKEYLAETRAREDEYGLLDVAAVAPDEAAAQRARDALADAGIRATTAPAPDGGVRILVFAADLPRAQQVVDSSR